MRSPVSLLSLCVALLALSTPRISSAAFHVAEIDEIMTSYGSDPNVQFLEIQMLLGGQGIQRMADGLGRHPDGCEGEPYQSREKS